MNRTLAFAFLFAAGVAVAQTEPAPDPTSSPTRSATDTAGDPAPIVPTAPTETAPLPTEPPFPHDSGLLQQKLDELTATHAESSKAVAALKPLKLAGYIQGRYVYADESAQGLSAKGSPLVRDGFGVRRGRLKLTYTLDWSAFLLEVDAASAGLSLKEAEVKLIEPWTGKRLELAVGQTKWPFGYEVLQSSSVREFPERSRVVRAFANGERDRGAKLNAKVGVVRFSGGVFDGNGISNKPFPGVDNDQNKDGVARLGVDLKWIAGGVSGWYGKTFRPATFNPSGAETASGRTFDRNRIGADLQLYLNVLPIGATALKGEFIAGRTFQKSGVEQFGVPALGWYALVIQNLGEKNAVGVRYDYFDPLAGTPDAVSSSDAAAPGGNNSIGTLGLTAAHQWNQSLKISATYELVTTGTPDASVDPEDNLFTLQFQAKF